MCLVGAHTVFTCRRLANVNLLGVIAIEKPNLSLRTDTRVETNHIYRLLQVATHVKFVLGVLQRILLTIPHHTFGYLCVFLADAIDLIVVLL